MYKLTQFTKLHAFESSDVLGVAPANKHLRVSEIYILFILRQTTTYMHRP
jgi:hypothetical protein